MIHSERKKQSKFNQYQYYKEGSQELPFIMKKRGKVVAYLPDEIACEQFIFSAILHDTFTDSQFSQVIESILFQTGS